MKQFLRVQLQGIKLAFASRAAYRFDFFLSLVVMFLGVFLGPLTTVLIYSGGGAIGGYGVYEVLLINAVFLLVSGLAEVSFFSIMHMVPHYSREGTLDVLLLRPQPLLSTIIALGYNGEGLGTLAGGFVLFFVCMANLPPAGVLGVLLFLALVVVALGVLFACAVVLAALGILWVGNSRLGEVYQTVAKFASYPIPIFGSALRVVLLYILPLGAVAFLPAQALAGLLTPSVWLSVLGAGVFLLVSLGLWRGMLRRYTGAGG